MLKYHKYNYINNWICTLHIHINCCWTSIPKNQMIMQQTGDIKWTFTPCNYYNDRMLWCCIYKAQVVLVVFFFKNVVLNLLNSLSEVIWHTIEPSIVHFRHLVLINSVASTYTFIFKTQKCNTQQALAVYFNPIFAQLVVHEWAMLELVL